MIYNETILPTNDLMFKKIFWNKDYPNILISFINAILKRQNPITSVDLISTEMDDEFIGEHGIRLDLLAKTSNNEILNIEMQKKNNDDMYKRSLFYWAKLYSSQLKKGQKYDELHSVIAINILDFTLFNKDNNRCHRNFILKDEETNDEWLRMIEMHFVELSKRQHMDQNDELWAWAEFLKAPNSEHLKWKYEESKGYDGTIQSIADAQEIFQRAIADPIEQEKIRLLEKTQLDNFCSIENAREKGKEEGKLEERKQLALNMKSQGFDNEVIAKCLSIDLNTLKNLLNY